jgi:hypothetical protein
VTARLSAGQVLRAQRELIDGLAWPLAAEFTIRVMEEIMRRHPGDGWQHFYPALTEGEFLGILAAELCDAGAYQVRSGINPLIRGLLDQPGPIAAQDVPEPPSPEGLAWFDRPPSVRRAAGDPVTFRALSWGSPLIKFPDGHTETGVRVTSWKDAGDLPAAARRTWAGEMGRGSLLLFAHSDVRLRTGQASPDSTTAWLYALWRVLGDDKLRTLSTVTPAGAGHPDAGAQVTIVAPA